MLNFIVEPADSIVYHVLPFIIFIFVISILISINEQVRKVTLRQDKIQKNIQKSSEDLSRAMIVENAVSITAKTLKMVYPYRFLILYVYYPQGNSFLCRKVEGINLPKNYCQVVINSKQMDVLTKVRKPMKYYRIKQIWQGSELFDDLTVMLPLVIKNEIMGTAVIGLNEELSIVDKQIIAMVKSLLLQFAITIKNIRISAEIKDKEKLAAIGSFSSGIIHNLKNPVDGLRMIVESLSLEIPEDNDSYEYIRELQYGIKQLKNMLINSLAITNSNDLEKEQISLNLLLNNLHENYKQLYPSLLLMDLGDKDVFISGCGLLLKQAFENLIQNALEASDFEKQVVLKVESGKDVVQIDIVDHGVGIDLSELDKIFTMFYSTRKSGRGLGLPIARDVIKNHNGLLTVKSQFGNGTVFTVSLPQINVGEDHE